MDRSLTVSSRMITFICELVQRNLYGIFTLHGNGNGTGTGNSTGTIGNNGSLSLSRNSVNIFPHGTILFIWSLYSSRPRCQSVWISQKSGIWTSNQQFQVLHAKISKRSTKLKSTQNWQKPSFLRKNTAIFVHNFIWHCTWTEMHLTLCIQFHGEWKKAVTLN